MCIGLYMHAYLIPRAKSVHAASTYPSHSGTRFHRGGMGQLRFNWVHVFEDCAS